MMNRGIGKAENAARANGASCEVCGRLHYNKDVAKRCEKKGKKHKLLY